MSYRRKHIGSKVRKLKPKKRLFKNPIFWIIVGIFLVVVVPLYGILFSNYFKVSSIEVLGNTKINSQDIQKQAWFSMERKLLSAGIFSIKSKSIFVVDAQKVINDTLYTFSGIETVTIKKNLPRTIAITVTERKPLALFCKKELSQSPCFLIDGNGMIFESQVPPPKDMFIIRKDMDNNELVAGENVVQKNIMDIVGEVKDDLKNNFQIGIKEVLVSNPLIITTSERWQLYFDAESDVKSQIEKMNLLLNGEITAQVRKSLQYIYLQYKDRAYYK